MSDRSFMEKLSSRWDEGKFVCVGLDSKADKIPEYIRESTTVSSEAQFLFNVSIVEATHHLVCAYKPNLAFYRGDHGKLTLQRTIEYINAHAPDVPVILDAKQGDIGSTNDGYVEEDFDWYGADAVTVNPYLGWKAMTPFLDQKNKGIIVLCKTSNEGAGEFQDLQVRSSGQYPTEALYKRVARQVCAEWNYNGNCALVVGATYTAEMERIRAIAPEIPFLIPGIGKQGGDLEATVKAGATGDGRGMVINNGSAIIFASDGPDFAEAARTATQKMHDDITTVLAAA